MGEKKRKLVDITYEEAMTVSRFTRGHPSSIASMASDWFNLRRKTDSSGIEYAQLIYFYDGDERMLVSFSDTKDAILFSSYESYSTFYRVIKYLESRGFDLEAAASRDGSKPKR